MQFIRKWIKSHKFIWCQYLIYILLKMYNFVSFRMICKFFNIIFYHWIQINETYPRSTLVQNNKAIQHIHCTSVTHNNMLGGKLTLDINSSSLIYICTSHPDYVYLYWILINYCLRKMQDFVLVFIINIWNKYTLVDLQ